MAQIVSGLFKDFTSACSVVRDLIEAGFVREQIQLIAYRAGSGKGADWSNIGLETLPRRPLLQNIRWGGSIGVVLGGSSGFLLGIINKEGAAFPMAWVEMPLSLWATVVLSAVLAGLMGGGWAWANARRDPPGGTWISIKTPLERAPHAVYIMNRYSPVILELQGGEGVPRPILSIPTENAQTLVPVAAQAGNSDGLEYLNVSSRH